MRSYWLQLGLLLGLAGFAAGQRPATHAVGPRPQASPASAPAQTPLTPDEVRLLVARAISNQRRDDRVLDSFERAEHDVVRSGGTEGRITRDRTFRVVPTGSGTLKIVVKEDNRPVSASEYQKELREWERVLEIAIHPGDPRQQAVLAKQQKRLQDRAKLVDAVPDAYRITWLGREVRGGRVLEKLQFELNPRYRASGNSTDLLTHARATVWIDPQAAQVARVEAEIIRDIDFGGGLLAKIYHGGHFFLEQAEAAPGIWEPTRYQYDLAGRKFLFPFEIHKLTLASRYRRIGAPDRALAIARHDLATGGAFSGDP